MAACSIASTRCSLRARVSTCFSIWCCRPLHRMKRLAILGSTGSIGQSALAVVDAHPDKLRVVALAAGNNAERMAEQIARYRPTAVAMGTSAALERVSADAALRHPTWRMGRKITIDSATLMNKGLEVIEAHWLFGVEADRIEVVIHPQSVVHSMVELSDGSIIAQLGVTDMRLPIQYACSYPDRWAAALPSLDLARCGRLDFDEPAHDRFPCLGLAYRALRPAT